MSGGLLWGIALGLVMAVGVWLIVMAQPWGWRPSLEERIEPQLRHHVPASRLLADGRATSTPWGTWGRLLGPSLAGATRGLQRLSPAGESLTLKLQAAGSELSVVDFRAQQVLCAVIATAAGTVLSVLLALAGAVPVVSGVALVVAAGLSGYVLRDQMLTWAVARRRTAILTEFPSVAELFALSVGAGESATGAMERIVRSARGEMAGEFDRTLADVRAGASLSSALKAMGRRVQLEPVERFIGGILIALDRGTPLADVLRAQAQDVRELGRRELMESAGRKEIQMMVPLVFGILPLTVVFAIFPGLALLRLSF